MESFAGSTLVANYAMVARRHMHEYGTTSEQLAEIPVDDTPSTERAMPASVLK
jgi:acetyl-CoA acetyltransferase